MILLGKTTTPEFGWKALTNSPLQGTTRSPWNLEAFAGRLVGRRLVDDRRRRQSVQSRQRRRRLDPHSRRAYRAGRAEAVVRPHRAISRQLALRRRDQPGRAVAQRARHGAGAERAAGPDPRDWRSLPAEARDYTIGLDEGVRGWRIGLSLDFGHVKADPEVRALVAAAARRFEELGAIVEEVGPLIEPLQNSFEPLWIGSFATRLRQIPTQLHGKLDPGFRAAAEKGLAVTLADYARAYEAKSKLARDMALWHQTVRPAAGAGDADRRAAGRDALQLRRLPALDQGRALYPALQPDRPARRLDAGRPHRRQACRSACRSSARRAPIISCCGRCVPTKAPRLDLAAAQGAGNPGPALITRAHADVTWGPAAACSRMHAPRREETMQKTIRAGGLISAIALVALVGASQAQTPPAAPPPQPPQFPNMTFFVTSVGGPAGRQLRRPRRRRQALPDAGRQGRRRRQDLARLSQHPGRGRRHRRQCQGPHRQRPVGQRQGRADRRQRRRPALGQQQDRSRDHRRREPAA